MSLEDGHREKPSYSDIKQEIDEKGYYVLPAGSIVDVRIDAGDSQQVPIRDIQGNPTEEKVTLTHNNGSKVISDIELIDPVPVGSIVFYSAGTGETRFNVTSPDLVEAQRQLDAWLENLAKEYQISDDYISEEHEEEFTGPVDISLYVHDYPEHADEIKQKEKELTEKRNESQRQAEKDFLSRYGIVLPEDKTVIAVSVGINTK